MHLPFEGPDQRRRWRKVGRKKKKRAQHPAGLKPTTSRLRGMCSTAGQQPQPYPPRVLDIRAKHSNVKWHSISISDDSCQSSVTHVVVVFVVVVIIFVFVAVIQASVAILHNLRDEASFDNKFVTCRNCHELATSNEMYFNWTRKVSWVEVRLCSLLVMT